VKNASSPATSDVPITSLNIVTPTSPKTALPENRRTTCISVKDRHPRFLHTRRPTPNDELLLDARISEDPSPIPKSPVPHTSAPPPCHSADAILDRIRLAYPSTKRVMHCIQQWAHPGRLAEIDEGLINSLCFLDRNLSLQTLRQLKEPRDNLQSIQGVGVVKDRSFIVPMTLSTLSADLSVDVDAALIDCGAQKWGYLNTAFVAHHALPTTALPHPIGVYNADGSLNKAGAITHVCTLRMVIGDHSEEITFRVTNTGSSNAVLGLQWLRFHDPLVNWGHGKLFFVRCPASCGMPATTPLALAKLALQLSDVNDAVPVDVRAPDLTSSVSMGPDVEHVRSLEESYDSVDDIDAEWFDILSSELGPADDAMLCVDLNERDALTNSDAVDPRILEHLRAARENASEVDKYLKEYAPVFAKTEFDHLPPRRPWDHAIELKPDAKPISSKIYPLSRSEQDELDVFLDEHLSSGRIRPSKSPIASPFFFIKKKDGSLRPVQDYRRLNDMTIKNRYPLPLVSELMDKLKNAKYFTKLDIRWGYNNVRLKEGDEHKAAFITNRGLFEPLVMFFGLTNSPATFQNMMNDVFRDLLATGKVVVYMDDILIFSDDLTELRLLTRRVLDVLQEHKLCLKPEKCVFEALEVEYLGVIVSHGRLRMDPKKIEALAAWPVPRNKKDVQQFLGFINFYRRFVRNFAKLATPLNRLCGSVPWSWTTAEQESFVTLREAGVNGPVLALPLDDAPFRVEADSSGYATGAVLTQLQDNFWRPVAYFSKALNEVERNYDIHDRELLSIMRALAEWRRYLHGSQDPFEIHSDHENLQYFMSNQKLNRRQARWSLELSEFNFALLHKPGSSMVCADALSRRPDYDKGSGDNESVTLLRPEHIRRSSVEYVASTLVEDIRGHASLAKSVFERHSTATGWAFADGVATWYNRIFVPDVDSLRERVLRECHDSIASGHPGRTRTVELILRDYWWPTLTKDAHAYVDGCSTCQRSKPLRQKPLGLLTPNEIPTGYWQIISCDFITDLPRSRGYDSVMVCVDRLSKMVRLIPCNKTISSEMAAKKYRDFVWKDFGLPFRIISDRGPQFVSNFMRALNQLLGITENLSTARRPQTDGQTERANQELEQYLRIFCNDRQSDWAEWLACAEFALNNRVNSSTGFSPFFLNYGRDPPRPLAPLRLVNSSVPKANEFAAQMSALSQEASAALRLAAASMKRAYDRHHREAPPLAVGSLVLLDANGINTARPSKKLDDRRYGPFKVLQRVGLQSYRLELPQSWKIHNVFHVSKLVPFVSPQFPSQLEPPRIPEIPNETPCISSIISHRELRNTRHFLVLLRGQNAEDAKWLDPATLASYDDPNNVLRSYISTL
jgi:transposase InsO family protein